jgi:hypothetical protein
MNPFIPFQLFRLASSPLITIVPIHERESLLFLATLLIVLDLMDCTKQLNTIYSLCNTYWYQFGDKIIDQVQYMVALYVLWSAPIIEVHHKTILFVAWIWRMVGVYLFISTKNKIWLTICPDLFKELLVLWYFIPNAGVIETTILIILKIAFEIQKSKRMNLHA